MKGSGLIKPSPYGYKLNDRVMSTETGQATNTHFQTNHSGVMNKGVIGTITGICGSYLEIYGDDGGWYHRCPSNRTGYLKLISREEVVNEYEIY